MNAKTTHQPIDVSRYKQMLGVLSEAMRKASALVPPNIAATDKEAQDVRYRFASFSAYLERQMRKAEKREKSV